jgi:hypothetical protein
MKEILRNGLQAIMRTIGLTFKKVNVVFAVCLNNGKKGYIKEKDLRAISLSLQIRHNKRLRTIIMK